MGRGMKKLRVSLVLCVLAWLVAVVPVLAAPSMSIIPDVSRQTPYQPITEQLGAQLQSLVQAPAAPEEGDEANAEPPATFGTRALNVVINIAEILRGQSSRFVTDFAALPQLSDWLAQQNNDPKLVARWQQIGKDLYESAGIAFLFALALEFGLYPARHALRRRSPRALATRALIVLSLFFLRALPILLFVSASVLLLDAHGVQKLSRFMIVNVVYALALARTTVSFLRGVFSPKADALRFIPATREQAVYGFRWMRAFSLLIIFGYFFIEVTRAVRVPDGAVTGFISILGLVLVVMGIIVILQKRSFVASLLRGQLSAAQQDLSWFEALRLWLARQWHRLAIAYLAIGYIIAATGVQDGLILMLRGTLFTLLVLVATRLLIREIGLWEARHKGGANFYTVIKGAVLRVMIAGAAVLSIMLAWGVDLVALAASPLGHRLMGSAFSIGTTIIIIGLLYEMFTSAVDRQLSPRKADGHVVEVNARARTLLPMLRNVVFVVCMSIVGVVVLSEAGINIAPLLAGAGVLGVAVGFGSQTLVKDFLTGLFIVLENTIAVGDYVKVGDHSGTVEAMSMRTLRLRDMDGSLHIVPFSEVSKIVNQTKNFAHALLRVNVATDTDLDKALAVVRAVGDDLRHDAALGAYVLEPVDILGVDAINDSSITLVARIRTEAGRQWEIRRMFLLRLKQRFDREGIQLPSTTVVEIKK